MSYLLSLNQKFTGMSDYKKDMNPQLMAPRLFRAVKQTEEQDLAHCVGQTGQQWHDPVIREDGQVLLVFGYLGDGGADARQHLGVCRLEQSHDQLQPSHQGAHHFPGVL